MTFGRRPKLTRAAVCRSPDERSNIRDSNRVCPGYCCAHPGYDSWLKHREGCRRISEDIRLLGGRPARRVRAKEGDVAIISTDVLGKPAMDDDAGPSVLETVVANRCSRQQIWAVRGLIVGHQPCSSIHVVLHNHALGL